MSSKPMVVAFEHPIRLRWVSLAAASVGGAVLAGVLGVRPGAAVGSYLGGILLAVAAFEFGSVNIRLAGKYAPTMTMPVAMGSYLTTAIALALVLAASSPRVVSGPALAVGLFVGLTIWLVTLVLASWVREPPQEPVNIRAQDETIPSSRVSGQ